MKTQEALSVKPILIYNLLIRILMLTMIIVQKKIQSSILMKIFIFIFTLVIIAITAWLITIVIMNQNKHSDKDYKYNILERNNRKDIPEMRQLDWWEDAVVYQIYLRSFKDSDGDGIGDLRGVLSKLDYFVDAGINVIWISPFFKSPMVDFGYDISDFYDIHYEYGNMTDFEEIVQKAHELGIRVLVDYVPNHASIESQYFKLSEARVPGYENFFVWADPKPDPDNATNRLLPSNWLSDFDYSIWEWNEARQQYYLHQFAESQADFNLREPAVRKELINILRFWLEKGADGFRIDALPYYFEATPDENGLYQDEPLTGNMFLSPWEKGYTNRMYTKDLNEMFDIIYEWREFVDDWQNRTGEDTRLLLAEGYTNITNTMLYYGNHSRRGVHFPFNFDLIGKLTAKSDARDFVYVIMHWLVYMPYGHVANWVLGNHDKNRVATRFGVAMVDGLHCLIMMLPGVPCAYQGDEIGMLDGYVSWEDTTDVRAFKAGNRSNYQKFTRDPCRTPFHWDKTTSAGFSTNRSTWLPVSETYRVNNLEAQKTAERSHYKVFQALTKLRKEPALSHGDYKVQAITENTLVLVRYLNHFHSYALLFNVGKEDDAVDLRRNSLLKEPMVVYTTSVHSIRKSGDTIPLEEVTLQAGEALVLRLPKT